jgi:hypothetical protein
LGDVGIDSLQENAEHYGALTNAGKRKYIRLWSTGESIRTEVNRSRELDDAETLVRLLTRVANVLDADRAPVA